MLCLQDEFPYEWMLINKINALKCVEILYKFNTNLDSRQLQWISTNCFFHCNSMLSKVDIIRDISFLWYFIVPKVILLSDEGDLLYGICDDFEHIFNPNTFSESELGEGRFSGGMVLYFSSSFSLNINDIYEGCHFSIIDVNLNYKNLFHLTNFYIPCERRSIGSLIKYQKCISWISVVNWRFELYNLLSNKPE